MLSKKGWAPVRGRCRLCSWKELLCSLKELLARRGLAASLGLDPSAPPVHMALCLQRKLHKPASTPAASRVHSGTACKPTPH